jgi:hypothetical protein
MELRLANGNRSTWKNECNDTKSGQNVGEKGLVTCGILRGEPRSKFTTFGRYKRLIRLAPTTTKKSPDSDRSSF